MKQKEVEVAFYNDWNSKFIRDYIQGNRRVKNALKFVLDYIPVHAQEILDVGCGIGWSSYRIAKHFRNARVIAVDLSPASIETAKRLFDRKNIEYLAKDITQEAVGRAFDCIVLIDVYEHISADERSAFNHFLGESLKEQGRIILTCPTKYHQRYLMEHEPDGLQPVDEIIEIPDLTQLALDTDTEIVYFKSVSVSRTNDYFHAVLEKGPQYSAVNTGPKVSLSRFAGKLLRRLRVTLKSR